jgi:hypothetical protein
MNGKFWFAPLTGILFIVLLIVGFAVGGDPPAPDDDSVEEIVDFYVDNRNSVMWGAGLQGWAGAMFIFFGGYLYKALRAAGAQASAIVAFAGTVAFAVGIAIDGMISFTLAELVDDIDPVGVQALTALWHEDFLPFSMGMFVFLMGFGVAIVRHGVLPVWMGWIAIVGSLTAVTPAFPVAGIAAVLLIVISSVMFTMRERAPQAA